MNDGPANEVRGPVNLSGKQLLSGQAITTDQTLCITGQPIWSRNWSASVVTFIRQTPDIVQLQLCSRSRYSCIPQPRTCDINTWQSCCWLVAR